MRDPARVALAYTEDSVWRNRSEWAEPKPLAPVRHGQKEHRMTETISWADFERVDIRAGTVVEARPFPEARKPAIILMIDFGPEIGVKKSSAQITVHYEPTALVGRQVMAVVNFPPRQIGPLHSEVLTLGFEDEHGAVVLAAIERPVPNGRKLV